MIIWTSILGAIVGIIYSWKSPFPSIDGFSKFLNGMAVISVLLGAVVRYVIASNRENSSKRTHEIYNLVQLSEAVLRKRENLLDAERKISQFEQFLRRETYHNIRFPDIKTEDSIGLEYTIRPVRDQHTGEPVKYENEMTYAYVVKVDGPAHLSVLKADRLKEYEESPIRDGEYAFCRFLNDSWFLGYETFPGEYKFYLSGKVGPVENSQTANQFMASFDNQLLNKKLISTFLLMQDGTAMKGYGGCQTYEIYEDFSGNLYLRIGMSLPKLMYYTNSKNRFPDNILYYKKPVVRGYASGQKLANIIESILAEIAKLGLVPKKIPWYETKLHKRLT